MVGMLRCISCLARSCLGIRDVAGDNLSLNSNFYCQMIDSLTGQLLGAIIMLALYPMLITIIIYRLVEMVTQQYIAITRQLVGAIIMLALYPVVILVIFYRLGESVAQA